MFYFIYIYNIHFFNNPTNHLFSKLSSIMIVKEFNFKLTYKQIKSTERTKRILWQYGQFLFTFTVLRV